MPCDSPFLPARSRRAAWPRRWRRANAQLAVAKTFDQPHPVFCLVRRDVLPHLAAFLEAGGRKIDAWYATLDVVEVPFDDEADAFRNINTADELAAATRPDRAAGLESRRRPRMPPCDAANDRVQDRCAKPPAPTTTTRTRCRSIARAR